MRPATDAPQLSGPSAYSAILDRHIEDLPGVKINDDFYAE
jgi:hypothetical protein